MTAGFTNNRPTVTGGRGRRAGDNDRWRATSTNWVSCYICGFLNDSKVRTNCPLCDSDNYKGTVIKIVR